MRRRIKWSWWSIMTLGVDFLVLFVALINGPHVGKKYVFEMFCQVLGFRGLNSFVQWCHERVSVQILKQEKCFSLMYVRRAVLPKGLNCSSKFFLSLAAAALLPNVISRLFHNFKTENPSANCRPAAIQQECSWTSVWTCLSTNQTSERCSVLRLENLKIGSPEVTSEQNEKIVFLEYSSFRIWTDAVYLIKAMLYQRTILLKSNIWEEDCHMNIWKQKVWAENKAFSWSTLPQVSDLAESHSLCHASLKMSGFSVFPITC